MPTRNGLMNGRDFESPYVVRDGRCTLCISNPTAPFPENILIDHIYLHAHQCCYKESNTVQGKRFNVCSGMGGPGSSEGYERSSYKKWGLAWVRC